MVSERWLPSSLGSTFLVSSRENKPNIHLLTLLCNAAEGVAPDHVARLLTRPSLFTGELRMWRRVVMVVLTMLILTLGIGNFILLPAALVFGR